MDRIWLDARRRIGGAARSEGMRPEGVGRYPEGMPPEGAGGGRAGRATRTRSVSRRSTRRRGRPGDGGPAGGRATGRGGGGRRGAAAGGGRTLPGGGAAGSWVDDAQGAGGAAQLVREGRIADDVEGGQLDGAGLGDVARVARGEIGAELRSAPITGRGRAPRAAARRPARRSDRRRGRPRPCRCGSTKWMVSLPRTRCPLCVAAVTTREASSISAGSRPNGQKPISVRHCRPEPGPEGELFAIEGLFGRTRGDGDVAVAAARRSARACVPMRQRSRR